MDEQDQAYEKAVLESRQDPAMAEVVSISFLDEDVTDALKRFRESEHWLRIRDLLVDCDVPAGGRVLDFGGGRGLVAAAMAAEGYEAVLCEPNPSDVCGAGAGRNLAAAVPNTFEVHNGYVGELAGGRPFDAVVCRAVLHHIHPLEPVLAEIHEVLRPGGVFIASDEPTIRREEDFQTVIDEHPFVPFGVEEWAGPRTYYETNLSGAGFESIQDHFPVSFSRYRTAIRPDVPAPVAALGYGKYRLMSQFRPHPPEARIFTGRRPLNSAA